MRGNGATYAAIAAELGVPESTVTSHCRRKGITTTFEVCPECGKRLVHLPKKKKKRFCSEKCRMAWWAKNPEAINKKAIYYFDCPQCGQSFSAYGNSKRKYCSQKCVMAAHKNKRGDSDKTINAN